MSEASVSAASDKEQTGDDLADVNPRKEPTPAWAIHRRLYDWMLSFAHKPSAVYALFGFAFVESSFFPIPPDVLLMPLCLGNRKKSLRFAAICTAGSVAGAFLGYALGYSFLQIALKIPSITMAKISMLQAKFNTKGEIYVFVAALTPIPFKLLTITAGAAKMNLGIFAAACAVGRATRFFAVAGVVYVVGPKAQPFIDKYFNLLTIVFTILLIGGLLAFKALH